MFPTASSSRPRRARVRAPLLFLTATAAIFLAAAPAGASTVGAIVLVTNDASGDNEPDIATNPRNGSQVIAGWNEYALPDGTRIDDACGYGWSRDGGLTWRRGVLRGAPRPDGGTYGNAADPGTDWDSQGRAYFECLYYDFDAKGWGGSIYIFRSTDGGRTYPERYLAAGSIRLSRSHDHPFITIDRATDTVYVAYSVFNGFGLRARSYVVRADVNNMAAGFSAPVNVSDITKNEIFDLTAVVGPRVTGGTDRTVYAVFGVWSTGVNWNEDKVAVSRSRDGARSFEKSVIVDSVTPMPFNLEGQGWRTGQQPIGAVDPNNGNHLWVSYMDYADGDGDLYLKESWDGGTTWSPRRPVGETAAGSDQLFNWLSVSPDGNRLDLIYYDLGYDPSHYLIDLTYASSSNGGRSWSRTRVTPQGFDGNLFPPGDTPFIGDYIQVESFASAARMAWTGNGSSSTEILTTTVTP
ncbi:MAG TPA: sialidase family protein [Candidatus Limnocylindrales bacterium]|nr:sialidase family protein [Candidatus Limnocylindrales bacterium]